jgi:uncharacterized protein YdhG (YjbR/CyaY superfamily)
METASTAPTSIDAYIATFPPDIQAMLQKISYRMPAFALDGELLYFAAFKKHIGVCPPVRDAKLKKEVAPYAGPKGSSGRVATV